ncbi:MAG: hypothetical protein ACRCWO_02090 [Bosea sp. (in: a-proteobacteria)]
MITKAIRVATRVTILGFIAVSIAACATAPVQTDLTAPKPARADAKTSLESGRNYR